MKPIEQIKRRLLRSLANFSSPRKEAVPETEELERQLEEIGDVPSLSAWYAKAQKIRPKRRILPVSLLGAVTINPHESGSVSVPSASLPAPALGKQLEPSFHIEEETADIEEYSSVLLSDERNVAKQEKRQLREEAKNSGVFLSLVKKLKERLEAIGNTDQSQAKSTSMFYMGLVAIVGIASIMIVGKVVSGIPSFSSIIRGMGWAKKVSISTETAAPPAKQPEPVVPTLKVKPEKTRPIELEVTNKPAELSTSSFSKAVSAVLSPLKDKLSEGFNYVRQQGHLLMEYLSKSSKLSSMLPTAMVSGMFRNDLNDLQSAAQKLKTLPSVPVSCCTPPPFLRKQEGLPTVSQPIRMPSLSIMPEGSVANARAPLKPTNAPASPEVKAVQAKEAAPAKVPPVSTEPTVTAEHRAFNESFVHQVSRVVTQPSATAAPLTKNTKDMAVSIQPQVPQSYVLKKDSPLQRTPSYDDKPEAKGARKTVSTQGKVSLRTVPLVPYDDRLYESNLVRL